MKRLSAIAFALTALASSAVAQSIVVVDKDGNQHKFCTDYVQDITFEVIDNRPNYSFSQIDVNPYDGVNVGSNSRPPKELRPRLIFIWPIRR